MLDKHHAAFFGMTKSPVAIGGDESGVGGRDKILSSALYVQVLLHTVYVTLLCRAILIVQML